MAKRGFGTITRLPSKRYRVRYTGPDVQIHTAVRTFQTRLDAEAWLTDERRLIDAGCWTPPAVRAAERARKETERRENTFGSYAKSWLGSRHDLRPTTRVSYETSLRRHLVPAFGDRPISEITVSDVRRWFASYKEKTPTARAHAYQVLSAVLAQAEEDGLITRNPARIRNGGRVQVSHEPEVLTLQELFALANEMPPQHRTLTLVCGLCGLRFGEAAALRRRDVDLGAAMLRIRLGSVRVHGEKLSGPPKTPAAVRDVAMPQVLVEALREQLARAAPGRDALVFPGADGNPLAPTTLYGRAARTERRGGKKFQKTAYGFYAARERIGRPNLHWHDLRRTAATLGAQSGATVREMQHRLGHTTPTMALRYQSATAERDRAIAERLQRAIDEVQQR